MNPSVTFKKNLKKIWLSVFILLVIIMISLGGITRLTRSGLSIVEWRPISGIIPPLTEHEWQSQFDLYKNSPEYRQVNSLFSIGDYKKIFIWEYLHRVLGRLIFLFAAGFGIYLWRKKIASGSIVFLLSSLVAGQGLIGWLMVKSGLSTQPHVSPYLLALHFFSALIVLLVAFYYLMKSEKSFQSVILNSSSKKILSVLGILIFFQIFYGCLVSGLKAGFSFNTYPLMAGNFFPLASFTREPWWINFFGNPILVQWIHRWLGIVVWILILVTTRKLIGSGNKSKLLKPLLYLNGLIFLQVILGILNILFVVPISLAVTHQFIATLVVLAYFNVLFRISKMST